MATSYHLRPSRISANIGAFASLPPPSPDTNITRTRQPGVCVRRAVHVAARRRVLSRAGHVNRSYKTASCRGTHDVTAVLSRKLLYANVLMNINTLTDMKYISRAHVFILNYVYLKLSVIILMRLYCSSQMHNLYFLNIL